MSLKTLLSDIFNLCLSSTINFSIRLCAIFFHSIYLWEIFLRVLYQDWWSRYMLKFWTKTVLCSDTTLFLLLLLCFLTNLHCRQLSLIFQLFLRYLSKLSIVLITKTWLDVSNRLLSTFSLKLFPLPLILSITCSICSVLLRRKMTMKMILMKTNLMLILLLLPHCQLSNRYWVVTSVQIFIVMLVLSCYNF